MSAIDRAIARVFDRPRHTYSGNCFHAHVARYPTCQEHPASYRGECPQCPRCPACEPELERVPGGRIERAL